MKSSEIGKRPCERIFVGPEPDSRWESKENSQGGPNENAVDESFVQKRPTMTQKRPGGSFNPRGSGFNPRGGGLRAIAYAAPQLEASQARVPTLLPPGMSLRTKTPGNVPGLDSTFRHVRTKTELQWGMYLEVLFEVQTVKPSDAEQ